MKGDYFQFKNKTLIMKYFNEAFYYILEYN